MVYVHGMCTVYVHGMCTYVYVYVCCMVCDVAFDTLQAPTLLAAFL